MRQLFLSFGMVVCIVGARAGEPRPPEDKAIAQIESGPLYLGSINSGFKVSEDYFDANLNLVAPVWSSLGSNGQLGGGIVFLEPYVSWGENGEVATSLGLGYRYLFNDQPVSALRSPREDQAGFWDEGLAIGANFFVDLLDTEADNRFWQLGFGLEVATRYIELRGNYYLPLTDKQLAERRTFTEKQTVSKTTTKPVTQTSAPYDDGQGFLVQDQTTSLVATTSTTTTLIRHILERYEEGMEGWDAEVALLVPGLDKWCDVKLLGGYFQLDNAPFGPQKGGTGNIEGWKAGVEVRPVPAVAVTAMWYEDERFLGSDWVFGARMEIPFEAGDLGDGKGMWGRIRDAFVPRRRHLVERLAEPVHRQNAAIHLANTQKQESKVAKKSTSSNTQVLSQTKNKIVLGLGPSGTDFTYASSGALTINDANGNTQTVNGSLFINKAGQSVFVPDGGGSAVLFANNIGSGNGTLNPNLVGATFKVPDNVFLGNASAGYSFNLITGGTTRFIPLTPVSTASASSLTLNMNPVTGVTANASIGSSSIVTGATLELARNDTYGGAGTILALGGTNTYTGATTISQGSLTVYNNTTATDSTPPSVVLTDPANSTRVITLTNDNPTNVSLNTGTLTVLNSPTITPASLVKSGAGTVILNGTSTFIGSINVNAGTLMADSWRALGTQQDLVVGGVSGTGTLILPQNTTTPAPTRLVLQNAVSINGLSVSGGIYPVSDGFITVNGGAVRLAGATLTAGTMSSVNTSSSATTTTSNTITNSGGILVLNSNPANIASTGNTILSSSGIIGTSLLSLTSGNLVIGSSLTGTIPIPANFSAATNLVLQRSFNIGGVTVPGGTYPITNGAIFVNGTTLPLSGASITVPPTTP